MMEIICKHCGQSAMQLHAFYDTTYFLLYVKKGESVYSVPWCGSWDCYEALLKEEEKTEELPTPCCVVGRVLK